MSGAAAGEAERPTVVIVDDAADVRTLVRTRLRLSRRVDVVAEAADGAEAVAAVREHRPDLVLLDVSMPVMDGLEALPRILEASPGTRVAMYSGFQERGLAHRALELGAAVFLEKSTSLDTLVDELLAVLDDSPSPSVTPTRAPAPPDADDADRRVLREHLERFREVFEDAAIGMATVTLAGQVVRANRALAELLGHSVDDLVGASYAAFAGAGASAFASTLADILDGSATVGRIEHDVTGVTPTRRVVATLAPVLDSSQRPLYLFAQVQDVSGQRGAEEMLRRSEDRFRLLVDNVEDYAIFMLSTEGLVESWNVGAERIKGYTADEIIGQHFRVFYPPELQEARHPEHELEQAMEEGHYEEEGWRIRKDGSRFWANVLITAARDRNGRHVGFAKVTRDVSRRRRQDEALRQSEERFRLLVDAVADYAIFMLNPDGRIASWNVGAERIKGYAADEIIGQHFRVFYPPELQEARHPEHELEQALEEGRYEEEGWRIRKDGSRFWANVVITAVHDPLGRHIGFAKITRDTSERRLLLEERERTTVALTAANARLQQAAEDQAHFLAVTAHELRTPVGVLGGTADTLVAHWEELDESERTDLLAGMTSSATRLRRLLTDLLTASRLQGSTLELDHATVDVGTVVTTSVATLLRTRPEVDVVADVEADAETDAETDAGPGLLVLGDADRLGQLVDNLLANALRHGRPPVRASARAEGSQIVVVVEDAGPGVPDDVRGRLFERFSTGRATGGTGLGLYIVRQLARAHGGDATYRAPTDAAPGAFVVTLPRAPV